MKHLLSEFPELIKELPLSHQLLGVDVEFFKRAILGNIV